MCRLERHWTPGECDAPPEGRRHRIRGYRKNKKWTEETPWQTVWAVLMSPRRRQVDPNVPPTPRLSDLALSVFCERRADWQPPEALLLDLTEAEAAFDYVYAENYSRVLKERAWGRVGWEGGGHAYRRGLGDCLYRLLGRRGPLALLRTLQHCDAGKFKIRIRNLGRVYNRYVLVTN